MKTELSRLRRGLPWVVTAVVVVVATVVVVWALSVVLRPAPDPLSATRFTYVTVQSGEVGSSINLNTVAKWEPIPAGFNQAAGVVTTVAVTPGDEVSQGSPLYTVNLRPVVVAQGSVPAFRSITGGTQGPDVAQLQAMLAAQGFYRGAVDGKAGTGTLAAIKAWQRSLGIQQSGVVELSDVIFVPSVPTRVSLDPEIVARGKSLGGGEQVLQSLPAAPVFTVPVTTAQAALIPAGTRVAITGPDGSRWEGFAADRTSDAQAQTVTIALQGTNGQSICADQCAQISVTGQSLLASQVITVETVEGLTVPSAALITDAEGTTAVIDESGTRLPVDVVTSARGVSIVEGVKQGIRVRIPAIEDGTTG